jgi:hypothetical protein
MIQHDLLKFKKKRYLAVFGLLLVVVTLGVICYFHYSTGTPTPIGCTGGIRLPDFQPFKFPLYLQTDPRWSKQQIGGSEESIAAAGCTLCCLSMAFECHGIPMRPDKLNALLKASGGYTQKGWVIWKVVETVSGGQLKVDVPSAASHELIDTSLQRHNPVLAKVLLPGNVPHWVLIVGKNGNEYVIADPLTQNNDLESLTKFTSGVYAIRIIARARSGL